MLHIRSEIPCHYIFLPLINQFEKTEFDTFLYKFRCEGSGVNATSLYFYHVVWLGISKGNTKAHFRPNYDADHLFSSYLPAGDRTYGVVFSAW